MGVFALTQTQVWPEVANAVGFVIAFFVSFAGHRLLSFKDTNTSLATSLRRFVVTALAGFASNEVVFIALLRGLGWPSLLALFVALLFAAGQTFVLSRFWAFRR
jgi:putative flippase GtrA